MSINLSKSSNLVLKKIKDVISKTQKLNRPALQYATKVKKCVLQ
jgi:hypothetical protein